MDFALYYKLTVKRHWQLHYNIVYIFVAAVAYNLVSIQVKICV